MMEKQKLMILLAAAMAIILTASAAMAADPVLNFDAGDPASGVDSTSWKSVTADSSKDWTFGAGVTLVDVTSTVPSITKAYHFDGTSGTTGTTWGSSYQSTPDATWEIWVKPADTGDPDQTIFESGANGKGMAIWYTVGTAGDNTGTISFTIDGGSTIGLDVDTVSAAIDTSEFRHIVCDFDQDYDGSVDRLRIFVDGLLVADNSSTNPAGIPHWWGTDPSGLGMKSPSNAQDGSLAGLFTGDLAVLRLWQFTMVLTDVEVNQLYLQNFISPANDGVAAPGDVTLEWVNLDPNTNDASSTYVDVWFGTDSDKTSGNYTKVVAGENVTSVTIPDPGPGIYYWQVDSYLNGEPTPSGTVDYTLPAEPNMIEGLVCTFTNDTAPSVNLDDMLTWTGQAVEIPTEAIIDDASSAVTYSWTADLPNGVEASFDPSATDPAPVVTFTKVPHANAAIANSSFEDPFIPDDAAAAGVQGDPSGWTHIGGGTTLPGIINIALANVADYLYDGITPDGRNMGWAQANQYLSQDLTETLQEGATYTLSAAAGFDSRWGATSAVYAVQLLAGSGIDAVVIAEATGTLSGTQAGPNSYDYPSVQYVYDAADADKIGLPLQVRLVGNDPLVSGNNANIIFDNVVLTSDPVFPATSGVSSVNLTLTVQDATNLAVSDTMTVEIYDDACSMSLEGANLPVEPTDFNADCTRDILDLAVMAQNWLVDFSITAPQEKPVQ